MVGRAGKTSFTLPFSQEVMADVLGMSLPHLNRMMQRLRSEKLIAGSERQVEFLDAIGPAPEISPSRVRPRWESREMRPRYLADSAGHSRRPALALSLMTLGLD